MPKNEPGVPLTLRIPSDAPKRADALIPRLVEDKTISALGKVTRSTVLKLALMRGLEALEKEHPGSKPPGTATAVRRFAL